MVQLQGNLRRSLTKCLPGSTDGTVRFLSKTGLPILEDLPLDGTSKTNIIFFRIILNWC